MILDATALLLLLNDKTAPPRDPITNEVIEEAHERVVALVEDLTAKGERVIVASPVLAELLVRAETAGNAYVEEFGVTSRFKMVSFDQKAAIEHALFTRKAIEETGNKLGGIPESWTKVKFDRQILAIAIANQAHTICTDDEWLGKAAEKHGLKVLRMSDLKLNVQPDLPGLDTPLHPSVEEKVVEEAKVEEDSSNGAPAEPTVTSEVAIPEQAVPALTEKGDAVVETAPPQS